MQAKLKRELSLFDVVLAGTGVIIGAGIYALIGAATAYSGNATWLAFLVSAFIALFTGLSYAELSSMFRGDSGEYDYIKSSMNKKFALFIAITLLAGTIISASTVALGFAGYLSKLIPVPLVVGALLIIVIMTLLNMIGIKETHWYNNFAATAEIIGLLVIIGLGLFHFGKVDYLQLPDGWGGIFQSAALVFFAFLGFENIVKLREEIKNPEKNLPLGIVLSVIITSVIYVLVAISAVSLLDWHQLSQSSAALASAAAASLGNYGFLIIAFIALLSTSNTVMWIMVAASRQIYGMSQEHSLPKFLSYVNPKTRTPWTAIIITSIIVIAISFVGKIALVANLTDLFLFLTFASVNLSLLILRYREPGRNRPFKVPLNIGRFNIPAFLGVLTSLAMIVFVVINLL